MHNIMDSSNEDHMPMAKHVGKEAAEVGMPSCTGNYRCWVQFSKTIEKKGSGSGEGREHTQGNPGQTSSSPELLWAYRGGLFTLTISLLWFSTSKYICYWTCRTLWHKVMAKAMTYRVPRKF